MWEQIRSNRIRSAVVVAAMGVFLVVTGLSLGAALSGEVVGPEAFLGGLVALVLWLVLWVTALVGGDGVLLSLARAREIGKADHPQLVNVVEEMTIAAALPQPPRVFLVEDPSPNAFATGRDPRNSAVAVTTGLLQMLDRDELQGVVAHELGHIKNRDVALMTTAGIMVGAVVLLAEIGLRVLWYGGGGRRRSRDSGRGGGQAVVLVVAIAFLILAPILSQILYFALSRRREYLADASGARFSRYPEGLASALEKIGASAVPLGERSRVTAPMYIVRPRRAAGRSRGSLWSTHPPLEERIRILRGMAGGAGFAAYERAYRARMKRGVVGARTLIRAEEVPARAPSSVSRSSSLERARLASDAYLAAAGYQRLSCSCGGIVKVPPALRQRIRSCPRCGLDLSAST